MNGGGPEGGERRSGGEGRHEGQVGLEGGEEGGHGLHGSRWWQGVAISLVREPTRVILSRSAVFPPDPALRSG